MLFFSEYFSFQNGISSLSHTNEQRNFRSSQKKYKADTKCQQRKKNRMKEEETQQNEENS